MIFKSRRVNLDPRPYRNRFDDSRWPDDGGDPWLLPYEPRPEFEPTRDPEPWRSFSGHDRSADQRQPHYRFRPRRDQFDTPVNPILVDVRKYHAERSTMSNPKGWDHVLRRFEYAVSEGGAYVTNEFERIVNPDHIAHARKVLSRLAALS